MRWNEVYKNQKVKREEICYASLGRQRKCPLYVLAKFPVFVDQNMLETYLSFIERTTPDYILKEIRMSRSVVRINSKNLTKRETLAILTLGRYVTEKSQILYALDDNLKNGKDDGNAFVYAHTGNDPNSNHSLLPYILGYTPPTSNYSELFVEGWKRVRTTNAVGDWDYEYKLDLVNTFYGLK